MASTLFSLAIITAIGFLGPFLTSLLPGKWVQSSAVVLLLGWLCGPHMLGLIDPSAEGLSLLKQLGLAFLFLMGGYELTPDKVLGPCGRHAMLSWLASFGLGLAVVRLLPLGFSWTASVACAIALTSTSLNKVESLLRSRHELATPLGSVVTSYGAAGELLPVAAVALLIGEHSALEEVLVILAFVAIAVAASWLVRHEDGRRTRLSRYVRSGDDPSQLMTQLVVAVLVGFTALGAILGADMLVAGFAAGWVLRRLVPEEDTRTMGKLRGLAYGFFIPVTFVLSGTRIDIESAASYLWVVAAFIGLLLLVRGVPVLLALRAFPETRGLDRLQKWDVCAYSCMAMATVVAMTNVAVEAGDMTPAIAGALVFAAALTTLIVPAVTYGLERREARTGARAGR